MNYKRIYDELIDNAKQRKAQGYTELHHIIPRCMGGDDSNDNLVRLTSREHYIAHELLFKHYRSTKLAHAWFSMLRSSSNQERCFTSRQYEKARTSHVDALRTSMVGANNHFFGRKHTEETKQKIAKANTGEKRTPEQIKSWVEKVAKKPKTTEHRAKISRPGFVMLKNIETGECIRIDKQTAIGYNSNIWKNPSSISQKRETCCYCGKESVSGNIKRWHNENCKSNPDR